MDVIPGSQEERESCGYEFSDYEWSVIRPMLPNKPRGVPRVDDRRILNGIFGAAQKVGFAPRTDI